VLIISFYFFSLQTGQSILKKEDFKSEMKILIKQFPLSWDRGRKLTVKTISDRSRFRIASPFVRSGQKTLGNKGLRNEERI